MVAKHQVEQAQRVARTMDSVSAIAADTEKGAETTVVTVSNLVRLSDQLRRSISRFRTGNGVHPR
jgi:methyl-accepting chemotaxis protein